MSNTARANAVRLTLGWIWVGLLIAGLVGSFVFKEWNQIPAVLASGCILVGFVLNRQGKSKERFVLLCFILSGVLVVVHFVMKY